MKTGFSCKLPLIFEFCFQKSQKQGKTKLALFFQTRAINATACEQNRKE